MGGNELSQRASQPPNQLVLLRRVLALKHFVDVLATSGVTVLVCGHMDVWGRAKESLANMQHTPPHTSHALLAHDGLEEGCDRGLALPQLHETRVDMLLHVLERRDLRVAGVLCTVG